MRNECGYKGPMPYWDEGADAMNLKASTIFDPKTGFGGDGKGIYRCINDGPFANLTLRFAGDLTTNINYCIIRTMNNCFFAGASKASTDACIAKQSFEEAWHCLEGSPHGAGHGGVGGIVSLRRPPGPGLCLQQSVSQPNADAASPIQMVNVQLSPGDPLFWLHHTWLDSLWWKWQSQNVQSRIKDMTGPNLPPQATGDFSSFGAAFGAPSGQAAPPGCFGGFVPSPNGTFQLPNGTNAGNVTRPTTFPLPGAGAPGSNPNGTRPVGGGGGGAGGAAGSGAFNPFAFRENKAITAYFGDGGGKITTMNHTLWSAGIFPNATIGDVMDLRGPYVCSEYV